MYRWDRVITQWFTDVVMTAAFQGHHLLVPEKPLRTLAAVRLARGGRTMCVFSQDVVDRNGTIWIPWNILRGITNHFYIYNKTMYIYIYTHYFIFSIEGQTIHILFQPLSFCLTSFYSPRRCWECHWSRSISRVASLTLARGGLWGLQLDGNWGNPLFGNGMEMHENNPVGWISLLQTMKQRLISIQLDPKSQRISKSTLLFIPRCGREEKICTSPPKKTDGFPIDFAFILHLQGHWSFRETFWVPVEVACCCTTWDPRRNSWGSWSIHRWASQEVGASPLAAHSKGKSWL